MSPLSLFLLGIFQLGADVTPFQGIAPLVRDNDALALPLLPTALPPASPALLSHPSRRTGTPLDPYFIGAVIQSGHLMNVKEPV